MARRLSREQRQELRRQGLRPVTFSLPDTSSPAFREEARRHSLAIARSPHAKEDQDFIDAISIESDTDD